MRSGVAMSLRQLEHGVGVDADPGVVAREAAWRRQSTSLCWSSTIILKSHPGERHEVWMGALRQGKSMTTLHGCVEWIGGIFGSGEKYQEARFNTTNLRGPNDS